MKPELFCGIIDTIIDRRTLIGRSKVNLRYATAEIHNLLLGAISNKTNSSTGASSEALMEKLLIEHQVSSMDKLSVTSRILEELV
jgi:hypothetical protein